MKDNIDKDYTTLIWKYLTNYFKDLEKVDYWLNTVNPLLGNISPIEMMALGKGKKVFRMIKNSIEGNNP